MKPRCASTLCILIVSQLVVHVCVRAQEPSAQTGLAAAINQALAGDFYRALITLNDVVAVHPDR